MSRYRKISVRLWGDERFRALSRLRPSAQALWLYLLTGPHTGPVPGLASVRLAGIAESLGWSLTATRRCWSEIVEAKMAEADWQAGLVWLPKAVAHNPPESPNVVRAWRTACAELPECALRATAIGHLRSWLREAFSEAFSEAFGEAFGEALPKGRAHPSPNQEQEQEQEQEKAPPVRAHARRAAAASHIAPAVAKALKEAK